MCGKRKGCVFVLLVVVVVVQVGLVLGGVPGPTGLDGLAQDGLASFSLASSFYSGSVICSFILSRLSCYQIFFVCQTYSMNPVFVGYYLSFIDVPLSCELEPTFMLIQQLSV